MDYKRFVTHQFPCPREATVSQVPTDSTTGIIFDGSDGVKVNKFACDVEGTVVDCKLESDTLHVLTYPQRIHFCPHLLSDSSWQAAQQHI